MCSNGCTFKYQFIDFSWKCLLNLFWIMFIGRISLIKSLTVTSAATEQFFFPRFAIMLLSNTNFDKQQISLINVSYPESLNHSFNSTHCSMSFGNSPSISHLWKVMKKTSKSVQLSTQCKNTLTSRARLGLCLNMDHLWLSDQIPCYLSWLIDSFHIYLLTILYSLQDLDRKLSSVKE